MFHGLMSYGSKKKMHPLSGANTCQTSQILRFMRWIEIQEKKNLKNEI